MFWEYLKGFLCIVAFWSMVFGLTYPVSGRHIVVVKEIKK